jgi:ABC-type uncharacterized transport system involved in gliding motility auxiliary subunit
MNKLKHGLFSAAGVAALFFILIAVNFLAGPLRLRTDLTTEKLHTLSPGTKAILARLDTPVKVRFYCTRSQGNSPEEVFLKSYAKRVEDLLVEYRQFSRNVVLEKLDPQPDSDAEDSARLDGVEGEPLPNGDLFYLGISVSSLDEKALLPPLSPRTENLIEYELSRAIARVANPARIVVGVMSQLPVSGQLGNPMLRQFGQGGGGSDPWAFITTLKRDFEVRSVEMSVDKIDEAIKVLLVVHPRDITPQAQFAIDQFVLRGGKLIAFLDPVSLVDQRNTGGNPMLGGGPPTASTLDLLLPAWGVKLDKAKVVADVNFVTRMMRQNRVEPTPTVLSVNPTGINPDDAATAQIDSLLLPLAGAFTEEAAQIASGSSLKRTVLVKSTPDSALVEGFLAQMSVAEAMKGFKPGSRELPLAIRLAGKFKTAFPEGRPQATPAAPENPAEKPPEKKPDAALKESKAENAVVLVADADLLADQFSVQVQDFFGQRVVIPRGGNLTFVQNLVEQMAGDENLINARSRATLNRPFERVRQIEAQANERFRSKIETIEKNLQETQRELNELQRSKDPKQKFILSAEQQAALEKFRKQEAETKVELKKVRKDLRAEIESLQNRIKWLNIAGMPLLVAFAGAGFFIIKRKRTATA